MLCMCLCFFKNQNIEKKMVRKYQAKIYLEGSNQEGKQSCYAEPS